MERKEEAEDRGIKSLYECSASRDWQAIAATADKVNHFEFIAIFKDRSFPIGAGHDIKVQFHGYAVGLYAELRYQGRNG